MPRVEKKLRATGSYSRRVLRTNRERESLSLPPLSLLYIYIHMYRGREGGIERWTKRERDQMTVKEGGGERESSEL